MDFVQLTDGGEIDTEQGNWTSVLPESRSGYARSPITHKRLEPGTGYGYRIFPYKDDVYGVPVVIEGETEPAVAPDTRLNLRVDAYGPTKLKLTWNEPRTNGGSDVTGYYVQVANDVDDNRTLELASTNPWVNVNYVTVDLRSSNDLKMDGKQTTWDLDDPDAMEYVYTGLNPNDARWFRVIALNGAATVTPDPEGPELPDGVDGLSPEATDALGSAVPVRGTTDRASVPVAPNGLVTEQARNSNLTGTDERGVLLLWNAPEDPTGSALNGYVISRMVEGGEWDHEWAEITETNPRTYITDSQVPAMGEIRYYRVAATNDFGTGAPSEVSRYPADTTHMHLRASGTIPAQTVTIGGMGEPMDAATYFLDAEGATYAAESDDTAVATAAVSGSMVTVTGVAEGMATIKVTATGKYGDTAMQEFMVTVTPADLTAPTNVMAMVDDGDPGVFSVDITWEDGMNAMSHMVVLFDYPDFGLGDPARIATDQDNESTSFTVTTAGTYIAVVVSIDATGAYLYDYAQVTVGQ